MYHGAQRRRNNTMPEIRRTWSISLRSRLHKRKRIAESPGSASPIGPFVRTANAAAA